jgi:hypothetical protein
VAGNWLAKFGGLQKTDAMLFYATHPAVPRALADYALTRFIPAIEAAFEPVGLEWSLYHTATTQDPTDRTVSLGGNAPGISRNLFGLTGALSFLVETRGVGVGRQGWQRRVATHYLAAKAVLEETARESERVRRTVAEARGAIARTQDPIILGHTAEALRTTIRLVDPQTAAERQAQVDILDTRSVRLTETRPRPAGYLVEPAGRAAVDALRTRGVTICFIEARPTEAEAFLVEAQTGQVDRESMDPGQAVKVRIERRMVSLSAGAVFVPMRQPAAAVISATLEPDSPGSHVGVGLVPVGPSGEAPIYRVPVGVDLPVDRTCRG